MPESLDAAINQLNNWIEMTGWAGYDPYDIKGARLFVRLQTSNTLLSKFLWRIASILERNYPFLMRSLLRVEPQINAKAMGLFAAAYLKLFRLSGKDEYKQKALSCLQWLQNNKSKGYKGNGWGYPFDWVSKVFIPKGTPSGVVSSIIGNAFWLAYEIFGNPEYLKTCQGICELFVNELNIDSQANGTVCFSYTPLDDFHVHNANLFVAEFLMRVGLEVENEKYIDLAKNAAEYSLGEQNLDGSLYYWGSIQNHYNPNHIDHYHSGFEIRSLFQLWKHTGDERYYNAVKKHFEFYKKHLLLIQNEIVAPKMTPEKFYPVDIHSCAEVLLCNSVLFEDFQDSRNNLPKLFEWIITNMQTEEGWFIYQIREINGKERKIKIPYMRWGQAWMLFAMASYLEKLNGEV